MDNESLRNFHLLTEISSEASITQRRLAKKQGLALGLTNLLIRRLVRKGYVKIVNLQRNRIRYLITPKGVMEKARLTYEYIEYSLYFYRQVREFLTRTLAAIPPSTGKQILLCGSGEVAEIAFLLLQQTGFHIVAVCNPQTGNSRPFMHQPVRSLEDVAKLSFDWAVVASLRDRARVKQELRQCGVSEAKIIVIPDEGTPEFRTEAAPLPAGPAVEMSPAELSGR